VIGKPKRCFPSNARKLCELADEIVDRRHAKTAS
jgi:hypothetical protein